MNIHFVYVNISDHKISPYSITHHLSSHLKKNFDNVYFYDWCESEIRHKVEKDDIVLAHPNYGTNTIGRLLFDSDVAIKASIHPLHHAIPSHNLPFNDLVDKVDVIFSIMGPYWYDTIEKSNFAHWKSKIIRLDMCVDSGSFNYHRERFNEPGKRRFVYIGCDRSEKGMERLYRIFEKVDYQLDMYGNIGHKIINLPNVTYHGRAKIDDNFGKMACEKYDFFVNTSVSDANPTTCTEAAAFGIPVICTVGTGYWPNEPFINIDDNNAVKTIEEYQHIDGTLLLKQARKQRRWAENDCNWDLFCNKITNKLFELHKNKAVP